MRETIQLMAVVVTGHGLTLDEVLRVARLHEHVELGDDVRAQVDVGRAVVDRTVAGDVPVYGLTTGVGVRKRVRLSPLELAEWNRRLILDHRVGQGEDAPGDVVRAQLLLVVNGFARGTSGVRFELVEHLVRQLNADAAPSVRTIGSLGMGDLPANADLAYGVLDGFVLAAKEGSALLSHNAYSTAAGALALADAARLLETADVAAALDLEALAGNLSVLHPAAGAHRPHPGLVATLARFRALLEGSYLWADAAARELQDPLSFRCAPQVHGAAHETLEFAGGRLTVELNASQENPLVVAEEERLVSVGSFDATALSAVLDFVRIALVPVLVAAAERAVKLLQAPLTGLPEGLAVEPGLAENALSEFAVPVQALAAEARLLAAPVSTESVSTSHHEGIEDRVSLAPLSGRRLERLVELGERILAIELVLAAQAVDLRGRPRLGAGTRPAFEQVRALVPATGRGEPPPQDLEPVRELVRSGALAARP